MRVVQVLGKGKIVKFQKKHPQSRGLLSAWVFDVEKATWATTEDIKAKYPHASFLPDNQVIFNIGGNKFRLEVKVEYSYEKILVLDVNTHAEYDKKNKKRNSSKK